MLIRFGSGAHRPSSMHVDVYGPMSKSFGFEQVKNTFVPMTAGSL